MSVPLQKFREIVLQLLFSYDICGMEEEEMIPLLMAELSVTKKTVRMARDRVRLIVSKLSEIDSLIAKATRSYSFERIQSVERNILRLGVFELLLDEAIPPKVAITEAMRLARKFSTSEAALFVNAILDHLHKKQLGKDFDDQEFIQVTEKLVYSEEIARKALQDPPANEA
jgi:N utilization substance protein B